MSKARDGGKEGLKRDEMQELQNGSRKHMMDMFIQLLCGDGFMNVLLCQNLSSCMLLICTVIVSQLYLDKAVKNIFFQGN